MLEEGDVGKENFRKEMEKEDPLLWKRLSVDVEPAEVV